MINALRLDAAPVIQSWDNSRKPRWLLWFRLVFMTPGFQLVISLRIQRSVARIPVLGPFLRRVIWYFTTFLFSCDIDPQAIIGPGLYIPHPVGIVIGGGIRIGQNVMILQNVTLGRGRRGIVTTPIIGDNVELGSGVCVLGSVTIGDRSVIGANSVVTKDIPAESVAAGAPAKIIRSIPHLGPVK